MRAIRKDQICELAASNIRYGLNATIEVGMDLKGMGLKNILVFTDPKIKDLPCTSRLIQSLEQSQLKYQVYSDVRVEPNDKSFQDAIKFTQSIPDIDGIVAIGGGSVIDTAKAANLYTCYPTDDFFDYVNAPLGKAKPVPGPVLPLIAIPTTAGTGSETTGVAIFDDSTTKSKTGIANRRLKPLLGIVDPLNTETLPSEVAKYSGFDVLCHAVESYTALPFTERPYPESPLLRPAYQGSNPISDIWALHALRTTKNYLARAVHDTQDVEARSNMLLASAVAGIGFGNAGVHMCHGMSYPVASQVKDYYPPGYEVDHPVVPHGHSVIVNAPAVFRFTGQACPERHLECAEILAGNRPQTGKSWKKEDAGQILADEILNVMATLKVPLGLKPLGYTAADVPSLVKGTLPQHRVTKLCPRPVDEATITELFLDALEY